MIAPPGSRVRLLWTLTLPDGLRIPKGTSGIVAEASANRWRRVRLSTKFADARVVTATVSVLELERFEPGFRGEQNDRRQQELFSRRRIT